jgi:hypothetical protein
MLKVLLLLTQNASVARKAFIRIITREKGFTMPEASKIPVSYWQYLLIIDFTGTRNAVVSKNNYRVQVPVCLTEGFLERKMTARKQPYDCRMIVTSDVMATKKRELLS